MPDYPADAGFLSSEERMFAVARMGPFAPNKEDKTFDAKVAKKTLLDPMFWLYATSYFFMVNSLNSFSYFSPTMVSVRTLNTLVTCTNDLAVCLTFPPKSAL